MASGLLFVFITSPVISANSPIKFGETKADSVASGSTNLANSCASFAETDLADQLTARIREDLGTDALDPEANVAATMVQVS